MEDLYAELAALPPETQGSVREYMAFLRWRAEQAHLAASAAAMRTWEYNFLEHIEGADVRSSRNPRGMEVKIAEAAVGGERRPALWQHPPIQGEGLVEYHAPVPAGLCNLRLRFAVGIRDGADSANALWRSGCASRVGRSGVGRVGRQPGTKTKWRCLSTPETSCESDLPPIAWAITRSRGPSGASRFCWENASKPTGAKQTQPTIQERDRTLRPAPFVCSRFFQAARLSGKLVRARRI